VVAVGTILSNRYLLQDELGAGGMSVVYRAVDLRTGANVAVKIPHDVLLRDQQYVQRLKREAQIAATIDSSRIAKVTDVTEHDDTPYLVMEYVSGEELGDRLLREGALPPVEAARIALDVARALDAANERGVVHRDLKPQNIRITPHGDVKVMDFGIARQEGRPGLTSASLFIGTPDYTAPERAEGSGDIRSDIYSLGVVLYEMLCGKLPYSGSTPWTVIQMHASEPLPPLPEGLPAPVVEIVERCLEKRPEDRYQTPRELVQALQAVVRTLDRDEAPATIGTAATLVAPIGNGQTIPPLGPPTGPALRPVAAGPVTPPPTQPTPPPVAPAPSKKGGPPLIPILAGVIAVILIAGAAAFFLLRGGDDDDSSGGSGGTQTGQSGTGTSGSTGGTTGGGVTQGPTLTIMEPAEGARIAGPVTIRLDVSGVNLKAPVEEDPQGRHIHYFLDADPATVLVPGQPIPTGRTNIIHTATPSFTFLDVVPGTHTIWAVITGNDHVPLSPSVQGRVMFEAIADPLANARPGEKAPIVYQSLIEGKWRIVTKDGLNGEPKRLTGGNANDFNPAFSPDGSRIAFNSDREGPHDIYTANLDGSDLKKITQGGSNNRSPAYSPDGKSIVFVSDRDGREHLWIVDVNGGEPRQLTRGNQADTAPAFALDGTRIYFQSDVANTTKIFVIPASGGQPRQITDGPMRDNRPVPSPDGKQIAFARFEGNQWNVYVMNADGTGIKKLTDTSYNINPSWSPDGKLLLFQSDRDGGQQQIFVMPVDGSEPPRRVTQVAGAAINTAASWPLR
jgi:serine/threonine-protein kinase